MRKNVLGPKLNACQNCIVFLEPETRKMMLPMARIWTRCYWFELKGHQMAYNSRKIINKYNII